MRSLLQPEERLPLMAVLFISSFTSGLLLVDLLMLSFRLLRCSPHDRKPKLLIISPRSTIPQQRSALVHRFASMSQHKLLSITTRVDLDPSWLRTLRNDSARRVIQLQALYVPPRTPPRAWLLLSYPRSLLLTSSSIYFVPQRKREKEEEEANEVPREPSCFTFS